MTDKTRRALQIMGSLAGVMLAITIVIFIVNGPTLGVIAGVFSVVALIGFGGRSLDFLLAAAHQRMHRRTSLRLRRNTLNTRWVGLAREPGGTSFGLHEIVSVSLGADSDERATPTITFTLFGGYEEREPMERFLRSSRSTSFGVAGQLVRRGLIRSRDDLWALRAFMPTASHEYIASNVDAQSVMIDEGSSLASTQRRRVSAGGTTGDAP